MYNEFSRSELLLGPEAMKKLSISKIAVFGIGGVGSFAAEALARCRVGSLVLIDNDVVDITNINRQLIALHSTVGRFKTDVMRERLLDINPDISAETHRMFYLPGQALDFLDECDYIIDAIDTVSAKLGLIEEAKRRGIPIISAMGCGNKLDPTLFKVDDIANTSVCPLCKAVRTGLKKRGIVGLKVVYSTEEPQKVTVPQTVAPQTATPQVARRSIPGSVSFVPSVAGLLLAGEVVREIIGELIESI